METKEELQEKIWDTEAELRELNDRLNSLNLEPNPRIGKFYLKNNSDPDYTSYKYYHVTKSNNGSLECTLIEVSDIEVLIFHGRITFNRHIDSCREISEEEYNKVKSIVEIAIDNTIKQVSFTIDRSNYCKHEE